MSITPRVWILPVIGLILPLLLAAKLVYCAPEGKGEKKVNTDNINDPSSFNVITHVFLQKTILRPIYRKYVETMNFRGNEHVLDFGSGAAPMAVHIADRLTKGGSVTCLDISEKWLNAARKRLKNHTNARFLLGDITTLNIPENSFDIVVIHFVLHDIPAELRPGIIQTIARVMKPGGSLYIREPVKKDHGMPADVIRSLMKGASLKEEKEEFQKTVIMGRTFSAVYRK